MSLEQRVQQLERLIGLPADQTIATNTDGDLSKRLAAAIQALERERIRISHLIRGYDEKTRKLEQLSRT